MAHGKLTPKQERFCQEYMIDRNATQAAIRAGYSAKTANEQGARLLANVSIKDRVQALEQKVQKKTDITVERVVKEFAAIGFGDLSEMKGFRGSDKLKALECLGKHLGMFKDVIEHTGKNGGPILTHELSGLSDSERAARTAALLDAARERRAGSAASDKA